MRFINRLRDSQPQPPGVTDAPSFNHAQILEKLAAMEAAQTQERERREAAEEQLAKLHERLEAQPTPEELRRIQEQMKHMEATDTHNQDTSDRDALLGAAGSGGQVQLSARPEDVERVKDVVLAVGEQSQELTEHREELIDQRIRLEALEAQSAHNHRFASKKR